MKTYIKTSLLFILLFLFARLAFSQDSSETRKVETIKKDTLISLLKESEILSEKIVILLKNDKYIVKTSLEFFELNMNQFFKEYQNHDDSCLLEMVLSKKVEEVEINVPEIKKNHLISMRLEFLTAKIIDNGQCWIINRRTGLFYEDVEVQHFDYYRNPLAGYGGRQYLIYKDIFFRVIDFEI